jgi:hypothetical protein
VDDAACGIGKKCVKKTVASLPPFPDVHYAFCAESCGTSAECSGNAAQRMCTSGACALRCDTILGVLDVTQRCPDFGMRCINNVCTWQN